MIPLIDDFTHVGLACARLAEYPADRFAVVSLNCALGEDLDRTRAASLLFILATLWILDRLFYRERDWRRPLLGALHPLLLIPFFWASQITTSMTGFWAAVWATLFVRWFDRARGLAALLAWSFVGASVRFEAFAYGLVFLAAYALMYREQYWPAGRERTRRLVKGVGAASIAILAGKYALQLIPSNAFIVSLASHASEAGEGGARYYPLLTYPFLQADSIARYLEGFALPWRLSYYGDWYQWWKIDQQLWRGPLRLLLTLAPAAALLLWLRRRGDREGVFRLGAGLFFFLATTAMLSSLPRNDWYYPVRAYLGTLCLLVFTGPLLLRRKTAGAAVIAILALSTAAHVAFHFSTHDQFRAYETEIAGGGHPFLDLDEAKAFHRSGRPDDALRSLHGLYSKIPVASAQRSTRAGTFWTLGLYSAWMIYDEQGRAGKAAEVYRVISHSTYYPAVHACLQIETEPVEKCLEGERKDNFCASLTKPFPKLPVRRPYPIDVEQVCRFKPLQKD